MESLIAAATLLIKFIIAYYLFCVVGSIVGIVIVFMIFTSNRRRMQRSFRDRRYKF